MEMQRSEELQKQVEKEVRLRLEEKRHAEEGKSAPDPIGFTTYSPTRSRRQVYFVATSATHMTV
jgi:hypothetical protein